MTKKFKPSKMVNWFEPGMLFQTGLRSVVSGIFGNYADRRETEAALTKVSEEEWNDYKDKYAGTDEIWIDYVGDTGDGFNSTFSIAKLVAEDELTVVYDDNHGKKKTETLPRAKILLFGGDQVYPTPAGGLYRQKFTKPFETAFPEKKNDADRPHIYAIPGNHDWYDGLGGFLKLFCQQRRIGNWETKQHRSYFARPLPNNYWVWGTDIQLDEDIDKPQLDYFMDVAKTKMQEGSKVILITAEPAWIYKQLKKDDTSYDRFRFFLENYITVGPGRNHSVVTILTGDLHHYSHYCTDNHDTEADHYFGSGGGGAFLHLSHNLPKLLDKVKENLKLKKAFPDREKSYQLLAGNIFFFYRNWYFSMLLGIIYCIFFWLLRSADANTGYQVFMEAKSASFWSFIPHVLRLLSVAPFLSLLSLAIIAGFWKFTDTTSPAKGVQWFGLLHGLIQCFSIYGGIWLFNRFSFPADAYGVILQMISLLIGGGVFGGFLMGVYLLSSNLIFGNHIDEASSSLACEDYKCFLRLRINPDGLTVYPIGIKKVTNWKVDHNESNNADDDAITVSGSLPDIHLIEPPIPIKDKK